MKHGLSPVQDLAHEACVRFGVDTVTSVVLFAVRLKTLCERTPERYMLAARCLACFLQAPVFPLHALHAVTSRPCSAQVRMWQALCILCPFVPSEEVAETVRTVWDMLLVGTACSKLPYTRSFARPLCMP